jgi:hypothetical protein
MPKFSSIEIRSSFAKAALARPILRVRSRRIKRNSDLEIRSLSPTLIKHATRSRREALEADAAICKYAHA